MADGHVIRALATEAGAMDGRVAVAGERARL